MLKNNSGINKWVNQVLGKGGDYRDMLKGLASRHYKETPQELLNVPLIKLNLSENTSQQSLLKTVLLKVQELPEYKGKESLFKKRIDELQASLGKTEVDPTIIIDSQRLLGEIMKQVLNCQRMTICMTGFDESMNKEAIKVARDLTQLRIGSLFFSNRQGYERISTSLNRTSLGIGSSEQIPAYFLTKDVNNW